MDDEFIYYFMADQHAGTIVKTILLEIAWVAFIFATIYWQNNEGKAFAWSFITLAWAGTISFEFSKRLPFVIPKNIRELNSKMHESNQSNTKTGHLVMSLMRLTALLCITVQIMLIMYVWDKDWAPMVETMGNIPDDFWKFTVLAYVASGFYCISGLGTFIILVQWGMNLKKSDKGTLMLYVIHDMFMGTIWTFLCSSFSDLFDDSDDTEWRVVFSSMVIFHVLTMLVGIFSNGKYKLNCMETKHNTTYTECWNKETAPAFLSMSKFAMYVLIYHSILTRLHDNDTMLIKMGFSDFGDIEIYIACGVLMFVNAFEFFLIEAPKRAESNTNSAYINVRPLTDRAGSRLKF